MTMEVMIIINVIIIKQKPLFLVIFPHVRNYTELITRIVCSSAHNIPMRWLAELHLTGKKTEAH